MPFLLLAAEESSVRSYTVQSINNLLSTHRLNALQELQLLSAVFTGLGQPMLPSRSMQQHLFSNQTVHFHTTCSTNPVKLMEL